MDVFEWNRSDLIASAGLLLSLAIAVVGVFRHVRSGPKLKIAIIPPRHNRKNKNDADRVITITVTNQGDKPANIWKLRLRTKEARFAFSRKVLKEAIFDDATPWKPAAKVGPLDSQTYDLRFFSEWSKASSPPDKIEVAVFIRGRAKPFIAHSWG